MVTDDRAGRSGGGRHWRHWLARSGRSSSLAGAVGTAGTTPPWADTVEPITYPEWVARYDTLDDDRLAAIARRVDAAR